ncbi:MAG TPA: PIN domain-containing protein [Acidimicrobiia bacterium]|nr:PIN domain-containing protein [Acidimicrobiia bacterium]
MSVVLLDTTFLIDAERADIDRDDLIHEDDDVAIAAITVAELVVGVELASQHAKADRQAYVDDILASIPVISYDRDIAFEHAQLLVAVRQTGRPRGAHDLLIAATARATNRTLLTADESAFADLPGVTVHHYRNSP